MQNLIPKAIRKTRLEFFRGISMIDLLKEHIVTTLKEKQQYFKENYWRKSFTSYAVTGEMPLTKTGARGKWYRNISKD